VDITLAASKTKGRLAVRLPGVIRRTVAISGVGDQGLWQEMTSTCSDDPYGLSVDEV